MGTPDRPNPFSLLPLEVDSPQAMLPGSDEAEQCSQLQAASSLFKTYASNARQQQHQQQAGTALRQRRRRRKKASGMGASLDLTSYGDGRGTPDSAAGHGSTASGRSSALDSSRVYRTLSGTPRTLQAAERAAAAAGAGFGRAPGPALSEGWGGAQERVSWAAALAECAEECGSGSAGGGQTPRHRHQRQREGLSGGGGGPLGEEDVSIGIQEGGSPTLQRCSVKSISEGLAGMVPSGGVKPTADFLMQLQHRAAATAATASPPLSRGGSGAPAQQQQQQQQQAWADSGEKPPTLAEFLASEVLPEAAAAAPGDIWGQTERDRVYNAILHVPYQLERLLLLGLLACLASLLSVFTMTPCRVAAGLLGLVRSALGRWRSRRRRRKQIQQQQQQQLFPPGDPGLTSAASACFSAAGSEVGLGSGGGRGGGGGGTPGVASEQEQEQHPGPHIGHHRRHELRHHLQQQAGRQQQQQEEGEEEEGPADGKGPEQRQKQRNGDGSVGGSSCGGASGSGGQQQQQQQQRRLSAVSGHQLYDAVCVGCALVGVAVLRYGLDSGTVYFWLKDLTQEFLKLQVIFTALEIADKALCNFGVDALEALRGTCCSWVDGQLPRGSTGKLLADSCLACCLVVTHCLVLVGQAMVFSVAMNSKKHALLALLIASNFVEIKGTVFKRFDSHKLWALTCQDIVERCHLLAALAFVMAEDMRDRNASMPDANLLRHCGWVYGSELVIDVVKHALLGKLNDLRPGVYREFMKDMCEHVYHTPSQDMHRALGFVPLSVAALCLRISLAALEPRSSGSSSAAAAAAAAGSSDGNGIGAAAAAGGIAAAAGGGCGWWLPTAAARLAAALPPPLRWALTLLVGWLVLAATHVVLGLQLKRAAGAYLRHYSAQRSQRQVHARMAVARIRTTPEPQGSKWRQ